MLQTYRSTYTHITVHNFTSHINLYFYSYRWTPNQIFRVLHRLMITSKWLTAIPIGHNR